MSPTCRRHVADIVADRIFYCSTCGNIVTLLYTLTLEGYFLVVSHWNDVFDLFYSTMNGCDILLVMSQVEQLQAKYYY